MQLFAGAMKDAAIAGYCYGQQTLYAISVWAMRNPEAAVDVTKVLVGDPHVPTTPQGMMTYGGLEATEYIADNGPEWLEKWREKYSTEE